MCFIVSCLAFSVGVHADIEQPINCVKYMHVVCKSLILSRCRLVAVSRLA